MRHIFIAVLCVVLITAWQRNGDTLFAQVRTGSAENIGANANANLGVETISGLISEAVSGEAVIGITVMLTIDSLATRSASIVRGTRSNKFGFYSMPGVPKGLYYLVVRGVGYQFFAKRVVIKDASVRENIALQMQNVRSQEVTVQAEREATSVRTISSVEVKSEFINKMPAFGGETDIFRALQLMPGIKGGSELSSGLYVRGGSPDQNLTLLDGVIVYNPSHLGGFLSVFNNDAMRDVRVIKGGFPAEYGGRLSSVIDLTMKEGSKEKITGTGNISLIASRLTVEGPITENLTFMLSGRRTYFDLLLNAAFQGEAPVNYYFYDFNAKLNYTASENDRIFLSGYFGSDVLLQPKNSLANGGVNFGIDWGNATGNLRWMHIVSPTLFTNFSAIYTDYRFGATILSQSNTDTTSFLTRSQIRDIAAKGDIHWFPAKEHSVKAGIDATMHVFTTALESNNQFVRQFSQQANIGSGRIEALEASIYGQDEWQITPDFTANLGLRLAYFQRGNRFLPEPRVSFAYAPTEDISIKGAFAVANQFLHLVVNNGVALPTDSWFPSTETILPGNSVQYILGAETSLLGKEYFVSVEGYYKTLRNLYEFKDEANFGFLTPAENQLTRGDGEAYGVELFINKRLGALTGWIGYTLSWTNRTFAALNDGKPFAPRYDRRHDISVVATYRLSDAWELGASWTFATGQAFTMPSAQFVYTGVPGVDANQSFSGQYVNYTARNGFRLPDFHKLDVNLTNNFTWFGLPFTFSINVYNVYNRYNPFAWVLNYQPQRVFQPNAPPTTTGNVPVLTQYTLFGIVPTIGLGFKF
jgi:TonB dependent receptor/TonB-dependent Receptor Plug Domain/Carboxypeptidase regulatory-like domain